MVRAHYRLLTEHLGVNHLRLVMGTSMGGMQTWVWGETYPDFMDALMPLASLPVEIAGRNRMLRKMILDAIRTDPGWQNGEYSSPPRGVTTALYILMIMGSAPLEWQKEAPTRVAADSFVEAYVRGRLPQTDANDMLYQFDASRFYSPAPNLGRIGGRSDQSAGAGDHGARDPAGEAGTVRADPDQRAHTGTRDAYAGRAVEGGAGEAIEGVGEVA